MHIERFPEPVDSAELLLVTRRLLDASSLCAIATVSTSGLAHINTAYFALGDALDLVWLSDPDAQHSRNIRANESVAIAVYDSGQAWGESDRGIQLFGEAHEVTPEAAPRVNAIYARRFTAYTDSDAAAYRLYECTPQTVKLFDERVFGAATFVTARVDHDGRLHWERTDVYRART